MWDHSGWNSFGAVVPKPEDVRKHALECMRLRLEALQLADEVECPDLKSHFRRVAEQWLELADQVTQPN